MVGTACGRPTSVPLDDVAVYLHRDEEVSRGPLLVGAGIGVAAVAGVLVWLLAGGL